MLSLNTQPCLTPQQPILNSQEDSRIPDEKVLGSYNMTKNDFEAIIDYVGSLSKEVDGNQIIKRNVTKLPFSLAVICKAEKISAYILFKRHGIEELGEGMFNRVTRAWDINNCCEMVFRNCKKIHLGIYEIEINLKLSNFPELFNATEDFFHYSGPWSKRTGWEQGNAPMGPKKNVEKEVAKVGSLLEIGKCSLKKFLRLNSSLKYPLKLYIALSIAQGLDIMHAEKIAHGDLKDPNILIMKDGAVKIMDFGAARYQGIKKIFKTLKTWMPPEAMRDFLSKQDPILDSSFDMWGFGILLLQIFCPSVYDKWCSCLSRLVCNKITTDEFEGEIKELVENFDKTWLILEKREEIASVIPLIKICLAVDPLKRSTAYQAVEGVTQALYVLDKCDTNNLKREFSATL